MSKNIVHLDCTLRDGGYYNAWDFEPELIEDYLSAIGSSGVDVIELGFRSLKVSGFKGACSYTTDGFLEKLPLPRGVRFAVMVNASELVAGKDDMEAALGRLFPNPANSSPVDVVRVACHIHEFKDALPASQWLKEQGFTVGYNLMQVADRTNEEIRDLARQASSWPIDVLYFADSMGGMSPDDTADIINSLREYWDGEVGVHTHDNMGKALQNTLRAVTEGATWLDSTVTGMGRGPGNARTEELAIELAELRGNELNLVPLLGTINKWFQPLKEQYEWGSNPYYYLSGKYGIHPTYIQEMLGDSRYDEEDILAVIEHLRVAGGKKFSLGTLDAARNFYRGEPKGKWVPARMISGREVLLLGTGPGVAQHRQALEDYIKAREPLVIALNTQSNIAEGMIDLRVACHPVRLLADCHAHAGLPQPLITPASMLPSDVLDALGDKDLLDFGLTVEHDTFEFKSEHCVVPTSLVIAYALAVVTSGNASRILMAGFDGYGADDPRNSEMNNLLKLYSSHESSVELCAVTPSRYEVESKSIYGMTL